MKTAVENRRLDLDAALAEAAPLSVVFGGKEYFLPGAMPAWLILEYLPYITGEGGLPFDKITGFLRELMGEDTIHQMMVEDGLSVEGLEKLVTWMFKEYGITTEAEEGEEAPNPQG